MNVRAVLLEQPWAAIKRQQIFHDKFLRWFLLVATLLCVAVWVLLGVQLRPTGFVVPFEYTSGTEFRFGDWRLIYGYGIFSLLVTFGNGFLATQSYKKSRISSFFLLLSAIVLNIFTLVVTYTLLVQIG